MIKLYVHIKIYLYYFPGRLKSTRLIFLVPVPKVVKIIP